MNDKMKKTYIRPFVTVTEIDTHTIVCTSVYLKSGGDVDDIGYGGIDGGGSIDPSSRSFSSWEDEE